MKYKAILITAIALATSVNAIELSGGVSADTKQSDYLSTAYLKATHNAFDLDFEASIISESDTDDDTNHMPKLYRLNVGSPDGSFKLGRQAPKFGIHKTKFIKKSNVYNLTDIVEDGLSHSGKVDNFNYSLFYSKNLHSIDVNRDFTVDDFEFNVGASLIDDGRNSIYAVAKYGSFSLMAQNVRVKSFYDKYEDGLKTVTTNRTDEYELSGVVKTTDSVDTTFKYKTRGYSSYDDYYVIELTYALTDRLWASYNTDNTLSLGIGINKNIVLNLERTSGHYDAKIKYSF